MRENQCDCDTSFEKYSNFPLPAEGLSAAGKWPSFQKLLPDFKRKQILDFVCAFSWHYLYAAQPVIGIY